MELVVFCLLDLAVGSVKVATIMGENYAKSTITTKLLKLSANTFIYNIYMIT